MADFNNFFDALIDVRSQMYGNTNKTYWHGTKVMNLGYLRPSRAFGESTPLLWFTNSREYARKIALQYGECNVLYQLKVNRDLEIFNARAVRDQRNLCSIDNRFYDVIPYLQEIDWFKASHKGGFSRDSLLSDLRDSGFYDGVFNFELNEQYPAIGMFTNRGVVLLRQEILDRNGNVLESYRMENGDWVQE